MSKNPLEGVKKAQDELNSGLVWLVQIVRRNRASEKLTLLAALCLVAGNPVTLTLALNSFSEWQLPKHYTLYWGTAIAVLLATAFWVAWRSSSLTHTGTPLLDCRPLKVLTPFDREDETIFSLLQREVETLDCAQAIVHPDFRFGVLRGESGSGKTSFLRAGLWPALLKRNCVCAYVKLSNEDPVASIRDSLRSYLPNSGDGQQSLVELTRCVSDALSPKTFVLLIDQFEQFFVQHKRKEQREPFVRQFRDLCSDNSARILLSIRTDFYGQLVQILDAVGWPQRNFELDKFTAEQATNIFKVIADEIEIAFDLAFVEKMSGEELASKEDGRISPVDIQILSWMILAQPDEHTKRFTRQSFQMIGGVEGLMERYLSGRLDELGEKAASRRQSATKLLVALTDLERNTRAGILSVADLRERLTEASITRDEIVSSLTWLSRSDVRLVVPTKRGDTEGYELAHERLVLAVRKEANKLLGEAEQASLLLDSRVNEWLGNKRDRRFLLTARELRNIRRQSPFVRWEPNTETKKSLVKASRNRIRWNQVVVSTAVVVVVAISSTLLYSWQRQRASIKNYEKEIKKSGRQLEVSRKEGLEFAATQAFGAVYLQNRGKQNVADLIQGFFKMMDGIGEGDLAPNAVVRTAARLTRKDEGMELLGELLSMAEKSNDERITNAVDGVVGNVKFERNDRSLGFLANAHSIVARMKDSWRKSGALQAIARIYFAIGDQDSALQILVEAEKAASELDDKNFSKGDMFRDMSFFYAELNKKDEAKRCLDTALVLAEKGAAAEPFGSAAMAATSDTYLVVGARLQDFATLRQATLIRERANHTKSAWFEIQIKLAELSVYRHLRQENQLRTSLSQAITIANGLNNSSEKAASMESIASVIWRAGLQTQANDLLSQALQHARQIENPEERLSTIQAIAARYFDFGDRETCKKLVRDEVVPFLKTIDDEYDRRSAIRNVVDTFFKLGEFQMARNAVSHDKTESEQSGILADALDKWALSKTTSGKEERAYHSWMSNYLHMTIVEPAP
jgi:tetratricopeptide (TPR) repeat protein